MGSAFHQLCPRDSGTLTPTAPTATCISLKYHSCSTPGFSKSVKIQDNDDHSFARIIYLFIIIIVLQWMNKILYKIFLNFTDCLPGPSCSKHCYLNKLVKGSTP